MFRQLGNNLQYFLNILLKTFQNIKIKDDLNYILLFNSEIFETINIIEFLYTFLKINNS